MEKLEAGEAAKKEKAEDENSLFMEKAEFVKENFEGGNYEIQELINSGLDGMNVIEKRDNSGELVGFISYSIDVDGEGETYLSIGIILTRKESRGEGAMRELFSELKSIASREGCIYIVAIADTEEGEKFFLENGFEHETDRVNGRECLKLEL